MKTLIFFLFLVPSLAFSQIKPEEREKAVKIHKLIEQYSQARETKDTVLLKQILTEDVDQLVSNGEWRNGIREAVDGMLRSSNANPGIRKLQVDKIKYLSDEIALVDCRYVITDPNGTERNLWSSFTVVFHKKSWKITAIRNMNPTSGN
ncbi:MAG TPA: nuclear transport factor 2 family protein [Algoriphagus sp.]|nr:nuclear transport factor 2 family protein [Algoriphagus sp.]